MPNGKLTFRTALNEARKQNTLLGFYIDFQSKTMRNARAYLPSICSRVNNSAIVAICLMRTLIEITDRGLVAGYFLRKLTKKKTLAAFLQLITGASSTVAPYALRIGGRTWKLSNGMDRQLVDFLGTWKSPDASARYFRGNPRAIILMLRDFYRRSDPSEKGATGGGMTQRVYSGNGDTLPVCESKLVGEVKGARLKSKVCKYGG